MVQAVAGCEPMLQPEAGTFSAGGRLAILCRTAVDHCRLVSTQGRLVLYPSLLMVDRRRLPCFHFHSGTGGGVFPLPLAL